MRSATTYTVRFLAPNGTYSYSMTGPSGWIASPYSGSLYVNGSPFVQTVVWSKFTYRVAFSEVGLPGGTIWSVSLAGVSTFANTSEIEFSEPNGSYLYSLGRVPGYRTAARDGIVTTNGSAVLVPLTFTAVTYPVTFREYGLPAGATWTLSIAGENLSTANSSLTIALQNGTYPYMVDATVMGGITWNPATSHGVVNVSGRANTTALHFARSSSAFSYTFTTFDEEILAATLIVVFFLALVGFVVRPLNRKRRTGPNPLVPPPDVTRGPIRPLPPTVPTAVASRASAGAELAPTPENVTALLRVAVVLGRLIAEQIGPEAKARGLELRRALDLIENYRLTEAMRVLGRLRTEVTRASRTALVAGARPPAASNVSLATATRARSWVAPPLEAPLWASRAGAMTRHHPWEPASSTPEPPISGVGASLDAGSPPRERTPLSRE